MSDARFSMPRRPRFELDESGLRPILERIRQTGPGAPSMAERLDALEAARHTAIGGAALVDEWMLHEMVELRLGLDEARLHQAELQKVHEQLTSPPWLTALFMRLVPAADGPARALVGHQGAVRIVTLGPGVDPSVLAVGEDVIVSHDLNVLLGPFSPGVSRGCEVGEFAERLSSGSIVLRSRETEIVVQAAAALAAVDLEKGDRVRWDPAVGMAFERLPRPVRSDLFLAETPTDSFADIGGLDDQIVELKRNLVLQLSHRDLAARYRLPRLSSVLLAGPPGTGKTLLARALANWLGQQSPASEARFIVIAPASLHSMWYSQTEANYRELFRSAGEIAAADPLRPVVIFIDEVDAVAAHRSADGHTRVDDRVANTLMTELDGFRTRENVLVVSATNRLDSLDPAMTRARRLGDLVIHIPRPNLAGGRAILERHLPVDVPYAAPDQVTDPRRHVIETAVSRLYAPNGEGEVGTITFRDGTRRGIFPRDLVSGAMLANIARRAIERACDRDRLTGVSGVRAEDVIEVVADEVHGAMSALTPVNCRAYLTLPQDLGVARVEAPGRRPRLHRFVGAA
jgi:proteasome-associated ATPase